MCRLASLHSVFFELMPLYKARVGALKADEKREELYVTMPSVVEDLLPKVGPPAQSSATTARIRTRAATLACAAASPPEAR